MRILLWHVHGSWTTAFVQGRHEYVLPVLPGRGPDGRGRARTWTWPATVIEAPPDRLPEIDLVVLQRPQEFDLVQRWTGRTPGRDLPAVYLEHNAPEPHPACSQHPLADQGAIPIVHVTYFNRLMWDSGRAATRVIEHGIVDPGACYTGELPHAAVVVNEPNRRARLVGSDIVVRLADAVPVDVFGMSDGAVGNAELHGDIPQQRMHVELARRRIYVHPARWTSLGLSLIEAMQLGMPVAALATTEVPRAVPRAAGVITADPDELISGVRTLLAEPEAARVAGKAAREHALDRYGLDRFLTDWEQLIEEVTS